MKLKFWRTRQQDEDLSELESYLDAFYQPITPRPIFVDDLKARLLGTPIPVALSLGTRNYVFLILAGVVSSVILIITGIRATMTVLGALGIIRVMRAELDQKQPSPLPPAV